MMNFLKRWWLPAFVAVLPFERLPSLDIPLGPHAVTLRLSLIMAAIGITIFGPSIIRKLPLRPSLASPYFWLGVYAIVMIASATISLDKPRSLVVIIATSLTVGAGIIVAQIMRSQDLPRLQKILFGTTTIVAAFGLFQFIGGSLGLPSWLTGLRTIYTKEVFGFPRVQSTGLEPLFFANYLLLPILLAAAMAVSNIRTSLKAYAQLFLFVLILALTLSRGGIIGCAVALCGLIVALLLVKQASIRQVAQTTTTILLAVVCAVGLVYLTTKLSNPAPAAGDKAVRQYVKQSTKVTSGVGSSDNDRVLNRRLALEAFRDRPLLGYGVGSFGAYAHQAAPLNYPKGSNSPTVNNEYFEILAETGLAGALALAGFVITLFLRLIGAWRLPLTSYHRAWMAALAATGCAYGIQYYAFSTLYIPHIWFTIGLLLAMTAPGFAATTTKARNHKQ